MIPAEENPKRRKRFMLIAIILTMGFLVGASELIVASLWVNETNWIRPDTNYSDNINITGSAWFMNATVDGSPVCTQANGLCAASANNATGWNDTGTVIVLINHSDTVSIGTSQATQKLHVNGSINITGTNIYINDWFAIGNGAQALDTDAIAIGKNSLASATLSLAIGAGATNTGRDGIAIGDVSNVTGETSIAIGVTTLANADSVVVIGNNAESHFDNSVALGKNAMAFSTNQFKIGNSTNLLNTHISGDLNVSGTIYQNNVSVCLSNNTNCKPGGGNNTPTINNSMWNVSEAYLFPANLDFSVGINDTTPDATLDVHGTTLLEAGTATTIPLTVQGVAAQSADLQEWKNGAGVTIGELRADGDIGFINKTCLGCLTYEPALSYKRSDVFINGTLERSFRFHNRATSPGTRRFESLIFGIGSGGSFGHGQGFILGEDYNGNEVPLIRFDDGSSGTLGTVRILNTLAIANGFFLNTNSVDVGANVPMIGMTSGNIVKVGAMHPGGASYNVSFRTGNTGSIFDWRIDSTNTQLMKLDQFGKLGIGSDTTPDAQLAVDSRNATTTGLIVQGAATQVANLTEWQNASGAIVASMNASGTLIYNSLFGMMWFENQTGQTTDINVTDQWTNITQGWAQAENANNVGNGFSPNTTTGEISPEIPGRYGCHYTISFSGGANDEYVAGIAKDEVIQKGSIAYNTLNSGGSTETLPGFVFTQITGGEKLRIQIKDLNVASDIEIKKAAITCSWAKQ